MYFRYICGKIIYMMKRILIINLILFFSICVNSQTRRSTTTTKVKTDSKTVEKTQTQIKSNALESLGVVENAKTQETAKPKAQDNVSASETKTIKSAEKATTTGVVDTKTTMNSQKDSPVSTTEKKVETSNTGNVKSSGISNTSAIANGQAASSASAPVARELKYKASEASVDYFKQLREKFEAEEKIRKDKEAKEAAEKAQREEAAKDARHLKEDQAPQFDKYRNGAKNEPVVKTTPEEDYKKLFK